MENNWRFRTSLFGKLVLQRCVYRDDHYQQWVDASTEDLHLYYKELLTN